jgi:hypothetical protein
MDKSINYWESETVALTGKHESGSIMSESNPVLDLRMLNGCIYGHVN